MAASDFTPRVAAVSEDSRALRSPYLHGASSTRSSLTAASAKVARETSSFQQSPGFPLLSNEPFRSNGVFARHIAGHIGHEDIATRRRNSLLRCAQTRRISLQQPRMNLPCTQSTAWQEA